MQEYTIFSKSRIDVSLYGARCRRCRSLARGLEYPHVGQGDDVVVATLVAARSRGALRAVDPFHRVRRTRAAPPAPAQRGTAATRRSRPRPVARKYRSQRASPSVADGRLLSGESRARRARVGARERDRLSLPPRQGAAAAVIRRRPPVWSAVPACSIPAETACFLRSKPGADRGPHRHATGCHYIRGKSAAGTRLRRGRHTQRCRQNHADPRTARCAPESRGVRSAFQDRAGFHRSRPPRCGLRPAIQKPRRLDVVAHVQLRHVRARPARRRRRRRGRHDGAVRRSRRGRRGRQYRGNGWDCRSSWWSMPPAWRAAWPRSCTGLPRSTRGSTSRA